MTGLSVADLAPLDVSRRKKRWGSLPQDPRRTHLDRRAGRVDGSFPWKHQPSVAPGIVLSLNVGLPETLAACQCPDYGWLQWGASMTRSGTRSSGASAEKCCTGKLSLALGMQDRSKAARADACVRQAGVRFRQPPRLDLVVWDVGDSSKASHRNHAPLSRHTGGQCWHDPGCVRFGQCADRGITNLSCPGYTGQKIWRVEQCQRPHMVLQLLPPGGSLVTLCGLFSAVRPAECEAIRAGPRHSQGSHQPGVLPHTVANTTQRTSSPASLLPHIAAVKHHSLPGMSALCHLDLSSRQRCNRR
eukprot:2019670-Rhodomonas_salina.1